MFLNTFPNLYAADEFYVIALTAQLKETPGPAGKNLVQLSKGEKVVEIERNKIWSKISTLSKNQMTGWVSAIMLSKNAPLEKNKSILQGEDLSKNARKRSSVTSFAGAARGLREDQSDTLVKIPKANYQDLKKMIGFYISPEKSRDLIRYEK